MITISETTFWVLVADAVFAAVLLFVIGICGLIDKRAESRRQKRAGMANEMNAVGGELFNAMYELNASNMAARQALIRESFIAAQAELADGGERDSSHSDCQYVEAEVIG